MTAPSLAPPTLRSDAHRHPATWRSAAGVAAFAVVVGATVWRAALLGRGWFSQNDFLLMHPDVSVTATTAPAGFAPLSVALAQAIASVAPLSWPVAAAVVLALSVVGLALAWHVLSVVLPGRWFRVPLIVLLATTPLTLWSTQWWTFALQFWPGVLGFLAATLAVATGVSRPNTRRLPRTVTAGLGLAVALAADERWVLAPVVLLGSALAVAPGPTLRQRVRHAVVGHAALWVAVTGVTALYAVTRALLAPRSLGGDQSPVELVTGYLRHLAAMLPGGPWGGGAVDHAYLVPPDLAVGAGLLLVLALAAVTLGRGGVGARIAWATLVLYTVAALGLLAVLRQGGLAASLDLLHRFGADAAVVVTVLLAAALREVPPPTPRRWPWTGATGPTADAVERAVALAVGVALVASAAVSTPALAAPVLHEDVRRYVEGVRSALASDPTVVLLDSGVPAAVLSPWFGDRARVSTVLARAEEVPPFDLPSQRLRLVSASGRLVPVVLGGPVAMRPGEDEACPRAVRSSGAWVPLAGVVPPGRWVARVGYYTASAGLMTMDVAGQRIEVPVQSGLNATDVVVEGSFDQFLLRLDDDTATLCLASLEVGVPTAGTP